jgi:tRNA 2-thiouridine synthesizing protein A
MSAETLDLRGIKCPLSWARAKVRLDELRRGDRLILLLDDTRALRDIPRAAEAAGHAPGQAHFAAGVWSLEIEA